MEAQPDFDAVKLVCPYCREIPETAETKEGRILFHPCRHAFRRDDLIAVIEYLRVLDELIQRHDEATTPLECQIFREEIRTTGSKLDSAAERCKAHMDTV